MSFDLQVLNGDLVIANSDLSLTRGQNKLIQDVLKICLTEAGSNPLQPWYGSLVSKTLIGNALQTDIIFTIAKSQLQSALDNLKNLQNLQVASGQRTTPDEMIAMVKEIGIIRNQFDPRLISVKISILTRAFGRVQTTFNVSNV